MVNAHFQFSEAKIQFVKKISVSLRASLVRCDEISALDAAVTCTRCKSVLLWCFQVFSSSERNSLAVRLFCSWE